MWMTLTYDKPENHPRISIKEKEYIQSSIGSGQDVTIRVRLHFLFNFCVSNNIFFSVKCQGVCSKFGLVDLIYVEVNPAFSVYQLEPGVVYQMKKQSRHMIFNTLSSVSQKESSIKTSPN